MRPVEETPLSGDWRGFLYALTSTDTLFAIRKGDGKQAVDETSAVPIRLGQRVIVDFSRPSIALTTWLYDLFSSPASNPIARTTRWRRWINSFGGYRQNHLVLRCAFVFQAATLAAICQGWQRAGVQALAFERVIDRSLGLVTDGDHFWKANALKVKLDHLHILVRFRLFAAGVGKENEIGLDATSNELNEHGG